MKDVNRIGRLYEFCSCRLHVNTNQARRLTVVNPRVCGGFELRFRTGGRLLRQGLLQRPGLIRDIGFFSSELAADVCNANALTYSASGAIETPRAGQVGGF